MWKILFTIILTSAFFILFFEPIRKVEDSKNKNVNVPASEFIKDSREVFIVGEYPYDMMDSKHMYGEIGTFIGYSSVPEDHWLHGFPHEKPK
jgi:hypothetical protein